MKAVRLAEWRKQHGVSRTTAWRLVKQGALQTATIGRRIFVTGTSPVVAERDLTGRRFGCVEVVGDSGRRTRVGTVLWTVRCGCGKLFAASGAVLETRAVDCGCGARCAKTPPPTPNPVLEASAKMLRARLWAAQRGRCALSGRPLPDSGRGAALVNLGARGHRLVCPSVRRAMLGLSVEEFVQLCRDVAAHAGRNPVRAQDSSSGSGELLANNAE